ncbi:hypothetical protein [Microvirga calopogonii]|uniref:Cap15 family cyclic dinucleotide receptor domain-containing protein n=1 Tax=Microvirga calopogonii TaxID=2078013 RepID=UPI0013B37183|nr:hypothetical protein [Microvirga calopogonii]
MLHLLPIRLILLVFSVLVGLSVLLAGYAGWVGGGDTLRDATGLIRWSSTMASALVITCFMGWRWIPAVQLFIFPYLGGKWSGTVRFEGQNGPDQRDVSLEIKHTLFGLKLLLDSDESTSWTLVVHADRNPDFDRYRLYYVYLNERKEGCPGAGERYRGIAVLRVVWVTKPELQGDYFTDTHRRGTLHLKRNVVTSWWKIWR